MKKIVKRLGIVAGVLVLVVVGVVVFVFARVDAIAKMAIERGGTYALGVNTTVKSADVKVFSGEFAMSGLEVANPEGFGAPHFLTMGSAGVAVSLASLNKPIVELPRLSLEELDVRLERRPDGSNYGVILANLEKLKSPAKDTSPQASEKKLVIDELSIKNVKVSIDLLGLPGGSSRVTVPIGEIKLSQVGKTGKGVGGTGVTLDELAGIVVQAVMAATVDNAGGLLPGDVLGEMKGALGKLGDIGGMGAKVIGEVGGHVEKIGGEVGKAAEQAAKEVQKGVEQIGEGLKGLIPGKKDEKKK